MSIEKTDNIKLAHEMECSGKIWQAMRLYYKEARKGNVVAKKKVSKFLRQLTPESVCDVFISYRREGGLELARLIYLDLKCRGYNVFFDYNSLRSGRFDEKILTAIETCKCFVSVLTPGALERCAEEGDWVKKEIDYAFSKGKLIKPIERVGEECVAPEDAAPLILKLLSLPRIKWDPNCLSKDFENFFLEKIGNDLPKCMKNAVIDDSTAGIVGDYAFQGEGFDSCIFRVFTEMIIKELEGGTCRKYQIEREKMEVDSIKFFDDLGGEE